MAVESARISEKHLLASSEESGTVPEDRPFRPDVEGLRAIAVLLVVLYHANLARMTGGFVGVDVFFVISGFVITGLLLRERRTTGATSIVNFYARRVRRILPAATLVILAAVFATYLLLGGLTGDIVANDGRWATVFLANFHFEWIGTNYLTAGQPPSPLQNYWSLSVEEQFYIVYPTLFLLVAGARVRVSMRTRLFVALSVIIAASFWLSVVQTSSNPTTAYFSPFTRAWELALGGLVAVGTPWLKHIRNDVATVLTWAGMAAILFAAFTFDNRSAYPGSIVAIPVVGAALVIAGGALAPRRGAEVVLAKRPFQWLGRRSYSLYLWHWPILIIAAERVDKTTLPSGESLLLVLVALLISMATYAIVENPIRHWRLRPAKSIGMGLALVLSTLLILSFTIGPEVPLKLLVKPAPNESVVLNEVADAPAITSVPSSIRQANYGAAYTEGSFYDNFFDCQAEPSQSSVPICSLGDPKSKRLMVVYGDSHAAMWNPALDAIAKVQHLKLVVLAKLGCPAVPLEIFSSFNPQTTVAGVTEEQPGLDSACDAWHAWATRWIRAHHPAYLIFSQADWYGPPRSAGSPAVTFSDRQWRQGLLELFSAFSLPKTDMVLLGATPSLPSSGPICLQRHPNAVQACSMPASQVVQPLGEVDQMTALESHVQYIDTVPWFCSKICTAIVGKYEVYDPTGDHVSGAWAQYLRNVLSQSLGFRTPAR